MSFDGWEKHSNKRRCRTGSTCRTGSNEEQEYQIVVKTYLSNYWATVLPRTILQTLVTDDIIVSIRLVIETQSAGATWRVRCRKAWGAIFRMRNELIYWRGLVCGCVYLSEVD